ncbi:MAG: hypothetical protein IPL10_16355 [Bacteroidetes bacterium]|nr:hypothetical protein [Bacteroidota bacterium]
MTTTNMIISNNKEKFKVLATEGVFSQVEFKVLDNTVAKAGIYLFGEVDGEKDLYKGPTL